jgi:hypothetical protein
MESLEQDLQAVDAILKDLEKPDVDTAAFCKQPTKEFLRERLKNALVCVKSLNEMNTWDNYKWNRGQLNSAICVAEETLSKYHYDSNEPITMEHQLVSADPNKRIFVNSHEVGIHSRQGLLALHNAMCASYNPEEQKQHTDQVKSAGWHFGIWARSFDKPRSFGTNVRNFFLGLANPIFACFNSDFIENIIMEPEQNLDIAKINPLNESVLLLCSECAHSASYDLGVALHSVGTEAWRAVASIFQGLWQGGIKQGEAVVNDFREGLWAKWFARKPSAEPTPSTPLIPTEAKEIKEMILALDEARKFMQANHADLFKHIDEHIAANASPSHHQVPYRPYDVITGLFNGIISIFDYFKEEVHDKHPVTGTLAMAVYYYCFVTCWNKAFLWPKCQTAEDISLAVGEAMASGGISEGIAAGFSLYKATFASLEFMFDGANSWLWDILSALAKNPGTATVAVLMSWATGYALTEKVDVPWLSEELRSDLGKIPFFAQFFAGLKLLVVTYEFFSKNPVYNKSYFGETTKDVLHFAITLCRLPLSVLSLSSRPWEDM